MTCKKYPTKVESEKNQNEKQFEYFHLYRFASNFERILIFLGIVFSLFKAFSMPLMLMVYGEFTTLLIDRNYRIGTSSTTIFLQLLGGGNVITNGTVEENRIEIINDSVSYGILMGLTAGIQFIAGIISVDLFNYTALKQVTRIRTRFFNSILRQEIGWFDVTGGNSIGTRLTDDVEKIREGIGEKVAHFLHLMISVVFCLLISFLYGWELTLVVIAYVPVVSIINIFVTKYQAKLTEEEMSGYSKAGTIVEEVLAAIRTVISFGGEEKESERYKNMLGPAQIAGRRRGLVSGIGEGLVRCLFFASTGLTFWYGTNLVLKDRFALEKEYTPTVLMIVSFGLLCSADNIARGSIFLETFSTAKGAAAQIFRIIDRVSEIDSLSLGGKIITYGLKGDVVFKDVCFHYPSRPDVVILDKLNVSLNAGQTIALVGNSGNGKSSCLHLLQRFYDVTSGMVMIDGHNIKDFNINWLRSNIAVVRQEPVLFATTIEDNIRYGKPDATRREIEDAARSAGAHHFIIKLPESYGTMVGERGAQLSGGQKQRIAIARAFIQNPKILLLDEATSALDSHAEKGVMEALDKCRKTRTTIIVSHRLSAIRNADRILFVSKGKIVEDGTHEELIALKGNYFNMVNAGTLENDELFEQNVVNGTDDNEKDNFTSEKEIKEMLNHSHDSKHSGHHVRFIPVPYKEQEQDYNEEDEFSKSSTFGRLLVIAYPEWLALFVSILAGILAGASYPAFAIILGELYSTMSERDAQVIIDNTNKLTISLLVIGIITGLACALQTHLVNWSGIKFASRIRSMVFAAIMQQEIGWYDEECNSVGALTSRIAGDTANVQGAIGYPMSGIVQSIATVILGMCSAFGYNWKLALVCLSTVPFVVTSYIYEAKHMAKTQIIEKSMIEEASKIATEAITNIRTVACLRQESPVISRFCTEIHKIEATVRRKLMYRGTIYSSGQSIPLFGYAVALYYGGLLVANEGVHYGDIIKTTESLLYVTIIIGQSLAYAPSFTSAFVAGHRLFKMLDRRPRIRDMLPEDSKKVPDVDSNVVYSSVQFRYPKRPDIPILQGFDLDVPQGLTIALVGNSGCGKSTCIRLLQRFYDADNGRINIGEDEITADITLKDLRAKLGLVSQEPVLFDRTIAENIAYGDNTRQIPIAEIVDAAKMANIHSFIVSLPNGYDTNLGTSGAQLSGGQKQRIAIARALIRNPKVLLLDEATSALDIQSEKAVQQALDLARSGRTCIIITHRLSSIQNADIICVVQNGIIHEKGTHAELMAMDGLYAKLVQVRCEDLK